MKKNPTRNVIPVKGIQHNQIIFVPDDSPSYESKDNMYLLRQTCNLINQSV